MGLAYNLAVAHCVRWGRGSAGAVAAVEDAMAAMHGAVDASATSVQAQATR